MLLGNVTKDNPMRELQVDSSIHKLFLYLEFTDVTIRDTINPGRTLLNHLDKIKVNVQRQTAAGVEHILLPIGLGTISEIAANFEGHINAKAYNNKQGFNVDLQFQLSSASLVSGNGEYLLLSIDPSGFELADLNIQVHSVEVPTQTTAHTEYIQHKANANTFKVLNVQNVDAVALPKADFQQVDFVYPTRTVTYKNELRSISQSVENLIANLVFCTGTGPGIWDSTAQTYFDGINLNVLSIRDVLEIRVLYSKDTNIITTQFNKEV